MIYLVSIQNPFNDTNGVACHILDLYNGLIQRGDNAIIIHPYSKCTGIGRFYQATERVLSKLHKSTKLEFIFIIKLFLITLILKNKINKIDTEDSVVNCEDVISLWALRSCNRRFKSVYTIHFTIPPWQEFQIAGYFKKDSVFFEVFIKEVKKSFQIENLNIVSVSKSSLNLFQSIIPSTEKYKHKFHIIYPGIKITETIKQDIKLENHGKYVINVGKVGELKNQELLIDIASSLKKMGVIINFILVGEQDKKYLDKLKAKIRIAKIESQFIFTGAIERKDVYNYVKNAELMIHTSKLESFGMSIVEAMGLGCPVLAYNYDALIEIMPSTPTAILDRDGDFLKNIDTIYRILKNKTARLELSRQQKKEFDLKFSADTMINSFAKVYNDAKLN